MAYNPFNFFRRNQKTFFAILTVVVMFMFVLQFGPGDFFSSIPKWFGGRSGETLAEIDGKKITDVDLRAQRQQRMWANEFLAQAMAKATTRVGTYVFEGIKRASPELKPSLERLLNSRMPKQVGQNFLPGTDYIDSTMWESLVSALQRGQIQPEMVAQFRNMNIRQLSTEFQTTSDNKTAKTDDVELAKAAMTLMKIDLEAFHPRETFFATVPVDGKNSTAMEFELWRKKAEKLGVFYTRKAAEELVMDQFFGQLKAEDWESIENVMLNREADKGFNRDKLRDALIEELKVRTAMTVVLGPVTGPGGEDPNYSNAIQKFNAPYELYEHYKKQFDQSTYAVVSVPVANFLDKVTETPNDQQLNDLFKKYKNDEPSPDRELPGFKEPRKLKLEWLEAKGDEPYFRDRAREFLPKFEVLAKAHGVLAVPAFPTVAGILAAGAPLGIEQLALQSAYEVYEREEKDRVRREWIDFFRSTSGESVEQSTVQPRPLAAAAIAAAASRLTMADPFSALVALGAGTMIAERDARIRAGAVLLFPTSFATPAIIVEQVAKPLPLSVVANDLKVKVVEHYARKIAFDDLTEFRTKMIELGKPKDQAPVRDYLEKFIKDRGLKTGASQEYRDVYTAEADPGLKPLKDRLTAAHTGFSLPQQFGQRFFGFTNQQTGQFVPVTALYSPIAYPGRFDDSFVGTLTSPPPADSTFFVWQTAERSAEAPKSMDAQTREKVLAAWKEMKARDMAKAKAEAIAKEAGSFGTSPAVIRQRVIDAQAALQKEFTTKDAQDRVKFFYFSNVSPIVSSIGFMPGRSPVSAYQVTPTENVPYPDFEKMRTDLLENRDKPLSTAFVMADRPKDHFYVTVLEARDTKGVEEFGREIYVPSPAMMGQGPRDIVIRQFDQEQRFKMREEAVALLKAELKYDKEHPDLAKKSDAD